MIFNNIVETIGNTPLVRLSPRMAGDIRGEVLVKVEAFNPGGSVKDRIGLRMIEAAEREGKLRPGGTIIESTSGNTGLGLAMAAAIRGYRAIFTMPDKMSQEKIDLLKAFGARVIVTPTAVAPEDPQSYYSVAKRLGEEIPNAIYTNQYYNPANPKTHYETTGPELWEQVGGKIDYFVAGMGTGGTISGTGKYLKEKNPAIQVVGADPIGSVYYDFFKSGKVIEAQSYKVEGVGEDIFPSTMDFSVLDEVVQVSDQDSFLTARRLARTEGILSGGSCGLALWAGLKIARQMKQGERMVVLLPDTGERYLSKVFNDAWLQENQFLPRVGEGKTVIDVVQARAHGPGALISVLETHSVKEALALMKQHEVSQMPVLDDKGEATGSVREAGMLDILVEGGDPAEIQVRDIMSPPFPQVEENTSIEDASEHFRRGAPAVVLRQVNGTLDIITRFDLLNALAQ